MADVTAPDWTLIPAPADDGAAAHLSGMPVPALALSATTGSTVDLSALAGLTVVYVYPMTGRPDRDNPEGWDMIPGARGCSPQSCAFRDHAGELRDLGAAHLFGLSSQDSDWQAEAATRLHLPFALLSDADWRLADALNLPRFEADGRRFLKRLTLILRDGRIETVFYPVFPPDRNAAEVMAWLRGRA